MLRNNGNAPDEGIEMHKVSSGAEHIRTRSEKTNSASGRASYESTFREHNIAKATGERNQFITVKKCNAPAFTVVVVMVLYLISELLLSGNYINSTNPYITVVIAQFCVYIIPCAFFFAICSVRNGVTPKDFGFRTAPIRLLGFGVSSLFILVLGGMLIKYTGYLMFGTVSSSAVSVSSSGDLLYIMLSGIIVPAITEEVLFRGVVFGSYERTLGSFTAILASALLFAFIHFDSVNFISYLYAGIILGIAAAVTRSVFAPIVLHLLNNFICIFSDTYLQRISKESISTVFVVFILTVLFLAVLFFYFESLELFCREKALDTANKQTDTPRLFAGNDSKSLTLARAFLAPCFIAALAIYLVKVLTM